MQTSEASYAAIGYEEPGTPGGICGIGVRLEFTVPNVSNPFKPQHFPANTSHSPTVGHDCPMGQLEKPGIDNKRLGALITPAGLASLRYSSKLVPEFVGRDSNPPFLYTDKPLPQ